MLPDIAALWIEGLLSYLEQLCLKSFLDNGHRVILYHYGVVENVPDGVEMEDASTIYARDKLLTHERTGSPAVHADAFRYRMLAQCPNTIWADTDAYCMRPFTTETGYFFGWESRKHINNGVLGLPRDCDTLKGLIAFTSNPFSIPTYYGAAYANELKQKQAEGSPLHAGEMKWGVWGPHALTHFLHETGEVRHAFPRDVLYPFSFKERRLICRPRFDVSPYLTENTLSIHLYGRRMRAWLAHLEGGVPERRSLLGRLLIKHQIDPSKAPIQRKPAQPAALDQV